MARFVPYLLVAVLLAARSPSSLIRAEFWAEDGTDFFVGALQMGLEGLWTPATGYFNLLPRAIAYAASWFPVVVAPYFYAVTCWLLGSVAVGWFSRDGFSYLVPSRALRTVLGCLIAIGPGAAEVIGNLCNLHNLGFFFGMLLLLEDVPRWTWRRWLVFAVIALSSPELILLTVPALFAAPALRTWAERAAFLGLAGVSAIAHRLANTTVSGDYSVTAQHLTKFPAVVVENATTRILLAPYLGRSWTESLMKQPETVFWGVAAALATAAFLFLRKAGTPRSLVRPVLAVWLTTVLGFALILVGRHYAYGSLRRYAGDLLWDGRYAFAPAAFALIGWMSFHFRALRCRETAVRAAAALGAAVCLSVPVRFPSRVPPRPDVDWPEVAQRIQQALDDKRAGRLSAPVVIDGIGIHPNAYHRASVTITP